MQKETLLKSYLNKTINYLKTKNKILFLTTSNRWEGNKDDTPKSTQVAYMIKKKLSKKEIKIIDVSKLKIYQCEGNVSSKYKNNCGVKNAILKDKTKNPSGFHRCWASINNPLDELWIISKELFSSDCVMFFTSIRWGQTNSIYQKLIERLTWLENRHSTLKEKNILSDTCVGIIIINQNWNGKNVLKTQKKVLEFYGFKVIKNLCWNFQFLKNEKDESQKSYKKASKFFSEFRKDFEKSI